MTARLLRYGPVSGSPSSSSPFHSSPAGGGSRRTGHGAMQSSVIPMALPLAVDATSRAYLFFFCECRALSCLWHCLCQWTQPVKRIFLGRGYSYNSGFRFFFLGLKVSGLVWSNGFSTTCSLGWAV
jgi:hypothetical protein